MCLPCTVDRSNKLNAVAQKWAQERERERRGTRGGRAVGGKVGEALLKITNRVLFISYTLYKS